MHKNNEQNLIPTNKRSKEEARELGRKGGINSGIIRRQRKTFAEIYKTLLDKENEIVIKGEKIKLSNKEILAKKIFNDVIKNEIKSSVLKGAEHIQATIGEAPIQKVEQTNYNIETKLKKWDIEELKKARKVLFNK